MKKSGTRGTAWRRTNSRYSGYDWSHWRAKVQPITLSQTPPKIATKTSWTDWRKTGDCRVCKLWQRGVLVNGAREVSCGRQREISK